jgi:hypothetical protein
MNPHGIAIERERGCINHADKFDWRRWCKLYRLPPADEDAS